MNVNCTDQTKIDIRNRARNQKQVVSTYSILQPEQKGGKSFEDIVKTVMKSSSPSSIVDQAELVEAACRTSKLASTLDATRAAPTSPRVFGTELPRCDPRLVSSVRNSAPRGSTAIRLDRPRRAINERDAADASVDDAAVTSALMSSTAVCKGFADEVDVNETLPSAVRVAGESECDEGFVYFSQIKLSAVSDARRV